MGGIAQSVGHRSDKPRLPSSSPSMDKQMGGTMATGEGAKAPQMPTMRHGKPTQHHPPPQETHAVPLTESKQSSEKLKLYSCIQTLGSISQLLRELLGVFPSFLACAKYLYCDCYSCLLHNLHCSSKKLQGQAASGGSQCSDALQELQTHATLW